MGVMILTGARETNKENLWPKIADPTAPVAPVGR